MSQNVSQARSTGGTPYVSDYVPLDLPWIRLGHSSIDVPLQLGSLRSVAHSFNTFAVNSFIDELAAASGIDPLALHRRISGTPRQVDIALALPGGRGRVRVDTRRLRAVRDAAAAGAGGKPPNRVTAWVSRGPCSRARMSPTWPGSHATGPARPVSRRSWPRWTAARWWTRTACARSVKERSWTASRPCCIGRSAIGKVGSLHQLRRLSIVADGRGAGGRGVPGAQRGATDRHGRVPLPLRTAGDHRGHVCRGRTAASAPSDHVGASRRAFDLEPGKELPPGSEYVNGCSAPGVPHMATLVALPTQVELS